MFKLRKLTKIINNKLLNQTCKTWSIKAQREKRGPDIQQLYANHEQLLYSSYLECQWKPADYRRSKWKSNKEKIPPLPRSLQLFKEMQMKYDTAMPLGEVTPEVQAIVEEASDFPVNWMDDYEFYEGAVDEEGNINSKYGTVDPTVPPSNVPCNGCGAHLHCASSTLPGYLPSEIFKGRTKKELQTIVCQRCHFLKHYNIALDVEVTPETYVDVISRIKDEFALAILIVDLMDFPCSIWPGMQRLLGDNRPVFVVGNKVDLLPRDSNNYLKHIKSCLEEEVVKSGMNKLNIKHVSLISAKTGYGIEELITDLHKIWRYKGHVYLMGCTNVGKSTLFNILLNSDYCRPEASKLVRKATTCPWPGTTLQLLKFPILRPSDVRIYHRSRRLSSEQAQKKAADKLRQDQSRKKGSIESVQLIGNVGRTYDAPKEMKDAFGMGRGTNVITTLDERCADYQEARWCYDTPGVMHPEQITNLLTAEELLELAPTRMISPRGFRLKQGLSVFVGGLARFDLVDYTHSQTDWIKILAFCSMQLPVVITETSNASQVYKDYLGTDVLHIPSGSDERLARWPGLTCHADDIEVTGNAENGLTCDVLLSSAGWIGLVIPAGAKCTFKAWTPHARGVYVRTPALIPLAERLIGKRIRDSLAYNLSKPFVFKN